MPHTIRRTRSRGPRSTALRPRASRPRWWPARPTTRGSRASTESACSWETAAALGAVLDSRATASSRLGARTRRHARAICRRSSIVISPATAATTSSVVRPTVISSPNLSCCGSPIRLPLTNVPLVDARSSTQSCPSALTQTARVASRQPRVRVSALLDRLATQRELVGEAERLAGTAVRPQRRKATATGYPLVPGNPHIGHIVTGRVRRWR